LDDPEPKVAAKVTRMSGVLVGTLCGILAAIMWAAGFVVAKHGIEIGFAPADLVLHRFFWTGLFLLPLVVRDGIKDLGGVGWGRGIVVTILSGPVQALLAYTGFILVPLGHGSVIQPATAALCGIVLAAFMLHERPSASRILGGIAIAGGLVVFGFESLMTIGPHGIGGDLLFALAGLFWAIFGILLRTWNLNGMRVVAAVGALSVLIFAPLHGLLVGYDNIIRLGWAENLLQLVAQGLMAGVLPILLFSRVVTLLGAGRAATFPALVPGCALIIGYFALGNIPSIAQLVGLAIVLIGFRLTLK
jgi:drug/metabolite transporter (DMT)-like permease